MFEEVVPGLKVVIQQFIKYLMSSTMSDIWN